MPQGNHSAGAVPELTYPGWQDMMEGLPNRQATHFRYFRNPSLRMRAKENGKLFRLDQKERSSALPAVNTGSWRIKVYKCTNGNAAKQPLVVPVPADPSHPEWEVIVQFPHIPKRRAQEAVRVREASPSPPSALETQIVAMLQVLAKSNQDLCAAFQRPVDILSRHARKGWRRADRYERVIRKLQLQLAEANSAVKPLLTSLIEAKPEQLAALTNLLRGALLTISDALRGKRTAEADQ